MRIRYHVRNAELPFFNRAVLAMNLFSSRALPVDSARMIVCWTLRVEMQCSYAVPSSHLLLHPCFLACASSSFNLATSFSLKKGLRCITPSLVHILYVPAS